MKTYFQFSRRQKIGVASLAAVILFLIILLNVNQHRAMSNPADVDLSQIEFSEPEYDSSRFSGNYHSSEDFSGHSSNDYQLFKFDPNTLNKDGWQQLGFSEKQANTIVNYRNKFGPFKKPEDVKKMYVVSEDKYEEIRPYMIFEAQPLENSVALKSIMINSASQEELENINGIGPAFAKRTISYRDLLGGFSSVQQFKEIYGITEDALEALSNNVTIDSENIHKININSATKNEIRNHPYLKDWDVISEILTRRDKERLRDLNFLVEKELMTPDEVNRVLPYIDFQ